jgi:hypothetical protein
MIMPIDNIPDWEQRIARQDAFWHGETIDRPVTCIIMPDEHARHPYPQASFATVRDRWLNAEYQAELALANVRHTHYLGDALPTAYANMGPEVFSAFFGCELEYGEDTSWSIPNLLDWAEVGTIQFSEENWYWKKLLEMTDALLEIGKGAFYTGMTDLHPGGDAIAAFRDPERLNFDMIEAEDEVKALLRYVTDMFAYVYNFYDTKLSAAGQPSCNWTHIVSSKRWHVPSNDFSCMVSKSMYDDIFLPEIRRECQLVDGTIYHLDGPNALHHLDSLLEIPELSAIQWVFGAGGGRPSDWMHVYQKCQAAGKGIQFYIDVNELDFFMESLTPKGLWIGFTNIRSTEEAEAVLRKLLTWKS